MVSTGVAGGSSTFVLDRTNEGLQTLTALGNVGAGFRMMHEDYFILRSYK